ncbi:MAG: 7-carboxy-7-deazaguanine synthase QueE [Pseudonocardiaceae bacterium]
MRPRRRSPSTHRTGRDRRGVGAAAAGGGDVRAHVAGEGPSCGRQALFVRLSRCNLSCPRCDTPYTWDWQRFDVGAETRRLTAADILDWALGYPTELLVITGGEPLLQQDLLVPLVTGLAAAGRRVEVETNGTIVPAPVLVDAVAGFNVSPKLAGHRPHSRSS